MGGEDNALLLGIPPEAFSIGCSAERVARTALKPKVLALSISSFCEKAREEHIYIGHLDWTRYPLLLLGVAAYAVLRVLPEECCSRITVCARPSWAKVRPYCLTVGSESSRGDLDPLMSYVIRNYDLSSPAYPPIPEEDSNAFVEYTVAYCGSRARRRVLLRRLEYAFFYCILSTLF